MRVLQTVVVKQVLTESSKTEILNKFQSRQLQLKKETEQLKFELKKLEKSKMYQPENIRKKFENEILEHHEKIKLLDFQIQQLHILPIGSEIKDTEVQAIVELQEGDRWDSFLAGKTIIVKDGIVAEIRER
ncbi:YlqD family protein [Bacillus sp. T33-2]|uniref:YlqD family protein n=1 Tax=Bacillus sp. T33-2 TaxID=2054168 RepID=UPI000C787366|nr:YlqD family protein [Bacillus sp. T33-2]PLR97299.1 hypothetical protein CVD19_07365 [Bacillus sp. T33-2]